MKESKKKNGFTLTGRWKVLVLLALILLLTVGGFFYFRNKGQNQITNVVPTNQQVTATNNTSDSSANVGNQIESNFDNKNNQPTNNQEDSKKTTDQSMTFFVQAEGYASAKDFVNAISTIDKAISADPKNTSFYKKKADYQISSKNKAGAIDTLNQAIAIDPEDQTLKNKLQIIKQLVNE